MKDLKAKFGFKPLYNTRSYIVSLEDMEPTTFDSMKKAAKAFSIGKGVIRYARTNDRDFLQDSVAREKVKVFL